MTGPLQGFRILEIAGIGPGPFASMLLADMGAEVIRVERRRSGSADRPGTRRGDPMHRSRRSIALDLKHPDGVEAVLRLVERSDGLIEGFRPGVMERLGLGPADAAARNPRLVYARITGWGQDGPRAMTAGHDIDYIALTGALAAIGPAGGPPVPPLNLVGDFGGGGMLVAFGMVCGLLETSRSGLGQVVDAAMVDGASLLMTMMYGLHGKDRWQLGRGQNPLDGGAPYYAVYECADGGHVAVGAIEPQFYAALLAGLGLDASTLPEQDDRASWPTLRTRLAAAFRTRTRDEWATQFAQTDGCVAPVLDMSEVGSDPHNAARDTFIELDAMVVPAPAPRFDRTPPATPRPSEPRGTSTDDVLRLAGYDDDALEGLRRGGVIG